MEGLNNVQLDNYLLSKINKIKLIPAASYQELFGPTGSPKFPMNKPVGFLMNMDKESGPGNHWVMMAIIEKDIFYYDPLLPNQYYQIPTPVKLFLIKAQQHGFKVIENLYDDQDPSTDLCGAYSAAMLVALDREIGKETIVQSFYKEHKILKQGVVQKIFYDIKTY